MSNEMLCRHPTLDECVAAGRGPEYVGGKYSEGGLPNMPEERERFEAYMRGHCWDVGGYDTEKNCYDTVGVRMLYGVWRDRGALPTIACKPAAGQNESGSEIERLRGLAALVVRETGEDEDGLMPHEPREALLILREAALVLVPSNAGPGKAK